MNSRQFNMRFICMAFTAMLCALFSAKAHAQQVSDDLLATRLSYESKAYEDSWRNATSFVLTAQEFLRRADLVLRCKSGNYWGMKSLMDRSTSIKIQELALDLQREIRGLEKEKDVRNFSYRVYLTSVAKLNASEKQSLERLVMHEEYKDLMEFGELLSIIKTMDGIKYSVDSQDQNSSWLLVSLKKFVLQSSQRNRYVSVLQSLDRSLVEDFIKIPERYEFSLSEAAFLQAYRDRLFDLSLTIQEKLLDSLSTEALDLSYKLDTHQVTHRLIRYSVSESWADFPMQNLQRFHNPSLRFNCSNVLPPKEDDLSEAGKRQYLLRCAKAYQEVPQAYSEDDTNDLNSKYPAPTSVMQASPTIERAKRIVKPSCKGA